MTVEGIHYNAYASSLSFARILLSEKCYCLLF